MDFKGLANFLLQGGRLASAQLKSPELLGNVLESTTAFCQLNIEGGQSMQAKSGPKWGFCHLQ